MFSRNICQVRVNSLFFHTVEYRFLDDTCFHQITLTDNINMRLWFISFYVNSAHLQIFRQIEIQQCEEWILMIAITEWMDLEITKSRRENTIFVKTTTFDTNEVDFTEIFITILWHKSSVKLTQWCGDYRLLPWNHRYIVFCCKTRSENFVKSIL